MESFSLSLGVLEICQDLVEPRGLSRLILGSVLEATVAGGHHWDQVPYACVHLSDCEVNSAGEIVLVVDLYEVLQVAHCLRLQYG